MLVLGAYLILNAINIDTVFHILADLYIFYYISSSVY